MKESQQEKGVTIGHFQMKQEKKRKERDTKEGKKRKMVKGKKKKGK